MSLCSNSDIRDTSSFDDTNLVKELTVTTARVKAERLILKCLKPAYLVKVNAGTLTVDEAFDLQLGNIGIAIAILCRVYALRYTMYKYNRSISTGSIGGESDRDSVKNLDFLKMFDIYWEEGWGAIADYVTTIPRIGGALDPYTNFDFSVKQNVNLDNATTDLETIDVLNEYGL